MYKIFRNLLLLSTIAFLISSGLVMVSYNEDHYMVAGSDKYDHLRSVPSPKIILIGGSNVVFGVDSEKIEKRLHIPVVNMGLTIGLGLKYPLNEITPVLESGDIILIMPEYELFDQIPLEGRSIDLGAAVKYCPECFLTSNVAKDPQQLALAAAGIFQGVEGDLLAKFAPQDDIYTRKGFNQRGDMVAHLGQAETKEILNHVLPIEPGKIEPAIELLNAFQSSCAEKNVRVFLTFPAIPQREYYSQKWKFSILHRLLLEDLEMPVLGAPEDYVYPVELFYDTVYHLNAAGRDKRTERIIELLSPALAK